jgi:hypothetical protein
MKRLLFVTLLFSGLMMACEDEITPSLEEAEALLVVDAWINNKPEVQTIHLNFTQSYFDNSPPPPLSNALVSVRDGQNRTYSFEETSPGVYTWSPEGAASFGEIGSLYTLRIEWQGSLYEAVSSMNRVPAVDSVTFFFEEGNDFGFPDSYFAEYWVNDIPGKGDAYWMQGWRNGQALRRPNEIITAFDAGFTKGNNIDGIPFIAPIRRGFNPTEQDSEDNFLPSYSIGDSLYVEVHSVTEEAFDFLNQLRIQIDRPGGFGELFAQPLANVPTNIRKISGDGPRPVGFFTTSAVSANGARLKEEQN